ncbi:MAG: NTP transferase domain-containing protein [Lacipirellulaceae bacterium]
MSPPARSEVDPVAVVLAAGKGTRMKSELPKVLVPVCQRPMIRYVVEALKQAGVQRIVVVVGYKQELVREELADVPALEFGVQDEQLGTGHAVMMCREQLAASHGPVIVVAGDSPMLQASSVEALITAYRQDNAACLIGTVSKDDPTGFGRIVRNSANEFVGIVEEKDATDEQRAINEVNVSTYLFHAPDLLHSLDQLSDDNAQSEYYITDCPGILLKEGKSVDALPVLQPCEALSINSMEDLAEVEKTMQTGSV